MSDVDDIERVALSMPHALKEYRDDERPAYLVDGKAFCFHRTQRRDAVDAATGERLDDVLAFRVADESMKAMWLHARPAIYFTTDHFNGHPWVLTRSSSLSAIDDEELRELIADAWLSRASKKLAQRWLDDDDRERGRS